MMVVGCPGREVLTVADRVDGDGMCVFCSVSVGTSASASGGVAGACS